MKAVVQKWGNSLALRIPKSLAEQVKVKDGVSVELSADADGLLVKPVPGTQSLKTLLARIRPENLQGEVKAGRAVGREIW
jgi:antitoxin MazE